MKAERTAPKCTERAPYARLQKGFTLVELLVSMTVLAILLVMISSVITQVQKGWRQASSKVSQFREARKAFDRMVNSLSQATLNNYMVYRYQNSTDPLQPPSKTLRAQPVGYMRYSELQFVCGPSNSPLNPTLTGLPESVSPGHAVFFQAPLGTSDVQRLPSSFNGCGFFLQFSGDASLRPDFINALNKPEKFRYRLYEYRSPTESNRVYGTAAGDAWYSDFAANSRPIANNIILMVLSPRTAQSDQSSNSSTAIAPDYSYDSKPAVAVSPTGVQADADYQLPPFVVVTYVAIDEASAENLSLGSGSNPPLISELTNGGLFKIAAQYDADLEALSKALVKKKVNFRVFTASVPIRASKWGKGS